MFQYSKVINNPVIHLARVLWRHASGYRKGVVIYTTMSILSMCVFLCQPLVMARLMNGIQTLQGPELLRHSTIYLVISVLVVLLGWALHGPSRVLEMRIAFLIKREFQMSLFRKITALPLKWHKQHHSGETIDQVAKASQALNEFAEGGFEILHFFIRFLGSICILAWFMPLAGLIMLIITAMIVATITIFDRTLIKQYQILNKRYNEVAAAVQDYLTNISTVISLRLEKRVAREVRSRTSKIIPLYRKNILVNEWKWFTVSFLIDFSRALVIFGFIFAAVNRQDAIQFGSIYALVEYLRAISDSFFQFSWKYGDLIIKSTRVRAIEHIEQAYEAEVGISEKAVLPLGWKKIEVQNLQFSHTLVKEIGDAKSISARIDDVNLTLEKGKSYALVGESGSGKSTVLALLRGLHRTDTVKVRCDGVDMPLGLAHISHHTTLIPQDPEIFSDSIRFNVAMGIDTNDGAILSAVDLARFTNVLARLPKNLDTSIAEKGVNLSGGERQRLALARGIFFVEESGSEIIAMDESTSSVDSYNERIIYEALLQRYSEKCVISAIHKFNLLELFDEVLVFVDGKIVERGSVESLKSLGGEFFRLWQSYKQKREVDKVEE